ncbi:MAG: sodium:solute symporter family protein [Gemmatimonadetes bacterium]|nr:sodium:solute symporter family protein [Gemmatimonadota bacterium]NNK63491.1 sodium:solute symporter family protein [Gemmatimonadota bacterium]
MSQVNPYYLGAFVTYLVVVLGIGVWAFRRTRSVLDFWVYGQSMGPGLATWSLVANFVSSVSVIGFIGVVYTEGYALMGHTILGLMLGLAALYFVVGYVRPLNVLTFPDLMARVTGIQASRPLAGTILLVSGWLYLVMQLAGASLLVTAITGVPYQQMVWVIAGVFIVYTVLGGLVSVAWTDLLQGVLMVTAVAVALGFMIVDQGGLTSINESLAALDPSRVSPTAGGAYTLLGISASFLAFFGTILTEQDMLIRIAATRDVRTAKIHVAAAGVILSVLYTLLVLLGGATTVALVGAGIELPVEGGRLIADAAFPALITQYVPTGVGVVIILAVMSAILSTTDTRLHAVGMTVARDLYSWLRPDATERRLMRVSRASTIVLGLTAAAVAVDPPGTIYDLYAFRAVIITSAFFIPVYAAVFWTAIDGRAVFGAVAGGGVMGLIAHAAGGALGAVPSTFVGVGTATLLLLAFHAAFRRIGGTPADPR